jgi:hypothetical protein
MTRVHGVRLQSNITSAASEIWLCLRSLYGCRREDGWKDYLESLLGLFAGQDIFPSGQWNSHFVLGSEESPLVFITRNFLQKENSLI